jgi:hypothetical protein
MTIEDLENKCENPISRKKWQGFPTCMDDVYEHVYSINQATQGGIYSPLIGYNPCNQATIDFWKAYFTKRGPPGSPNLLRELEFMYWDESFKG